MAEVFVVEPSPKFQNRLVIVPSELSVKFTVSGLRPMLGVPLKFAAGRRAPVPATGLVLLPPLLVIVTTLVKAPSLVGLKRIMRLVAPKPGRVKGVPEEMVKGPPPPIAANPLEIAAAPRFVAIKLS